MKIIYLNRIFSNLEESLILFCSKVSLARFNFFVVVLLQVKTVRKVPHQWRQLSLAKKDQLLARPKDFLKSEARHFAVWLKSDNIFFIFSLF